MFYLSWMQGMMKRGWPGRDVLPSHKPTQPGARGLPFTKNIYFVPSSFMDCPISIFMISLETEIIQLAESCTWQCCGRMDVWIPFSLTLGFVCLLDYSVSSGHFQTADLPEVAKQCNIDPGRRREVSLHVAHGSLASCWQSRHASVEKGSRNSCLGS